MSPDVKHEAILRDNNIWIRETGNVDSARQLSFDGTDQKCYVRVLWSPDSKKLAGIKKEEIKERQILLSESHFAAATTTGWTRCGGTSSGWATPSVLGTARIPTFIPLQRCKSSRNLSNTTNTSNRCTSQGKATTLAATTSPSASTNFSGRTSRRAARALA